MILNPLQAIHFLVVVMLWFDPPGFSLVLLSRVLSGAGLPRPVVCAEFTDSHMRRARVCPADRIGDSIHRTFLWTSRTTSVLCVSCALEKCKKDQGSSAPVRGYGSNLGWALWVVGLSPSVSVFVCPPVRLEEKKVF